MKISVLLTLFIVVGFILATGCVVQTKNDVNNTPVSTTNTFTPFVNTTINSTNNSNVTNATNVTPLKGPLRISISGYPAPLSVTLDNQTVGTVTREKPIDLMVDEGIHTVMVCVGTLCEKENVTVVFAKKSSVDFGERLKKDVEFPLPTVRLFEYYKNSQGVTVTVEFINPSESDLSMSAEISVGYSYIDPRTDIRMGDSVRGKIIESLRSGERGSSALNLYFVDGDAYNFDPPTLSNIIYKNITL